MSENKMVFFIITVIVAFCFLSPALATNRQQESLYSDIDAGTRDKLNAKNQEILKFNLPAPDSANYLITGWNFRKAGQYYGILSKISTFDSAGSMVEKQSYVELLDTGNDLIASLFTLDGKTIFGYASIPENTPYENSQTSQTNPQNASPTTTNVPEPENNVQNMPTASPEVGNPQNAVSDTASASSTADYSSVQNITSVIAAMKTKTDIQKPEYINSITGEIFRVKGTVIDVDDDGELRVRVDGAGLSDSFSVTGMSTEILLTMDKEKPVDLVCRLTKYQNFIFNYYDFVFIGFFDGQKYTEAPAAESSSSAPANPSNVYHAGDTVQTAEGPITFNSGQVIGNQLITDFTISNTTNEEITISSIMQFTAKNNDGSKLEQDYFNCTISAIDGTIVPGDKTKGGVCYTGLTGGPYRIYYQQGFWNATTYIFEIN